MGSGLEKEFVTLHEIVKAAKSRLTANIWDYLVGGTETETTLRRNRMALDSIAFKPRVLRDVSTVDPSSEVFGKKLRIPVVLAPVGSLGIGLALASLTEREAVAVFAAVALALAVWGTLSPPLRPPIVP